MLVAFAILGQLMKFGILCRTALHWACAVGSNRCVAGLLRLGVKHNRTDNYGVTPNVYAKRLNHHGCVSLVQNYDPQRPQDVLIPVESLSDYSNSIEKISCHKEAMSNIEEDVFYRTSSRDKEVSNIEKVAQADYDQPLSAMDDLESLKNACDDALTFKVRYSDCDSNSSGDDEKAGNLVVRQGSINFHVLFYTRSRKQAHAHMQARTHRLLRTRTFKVYVQSHHSIFFGFQNLIVMQLISIIVVFVVMCQDISSNKVIIYIFVNMCYLNI